MVLEYETGSMLPGKCKSLIQIEWRTSDSLQCQLAENLPSCPGKTRKYRVFKRYYHLRFLHGRGNTIFVLFFWFMV